MIDWPADLSAVFEWRFEKGLWTRRPLVEQEDLENWTGTTAGPPVPEQTNRYVLTAVGPLSALDVRMASRTVLVAVTAGSVLLIGLAILTFPIVRRPALLFIGAVLLMAVAILYPDLAVVLAKLATVGACLVLLAVILERYLHARRRTPLVIRTGSNSVHEPGSTKTHLRIQPSSSSGESVARVAQAAAPSGEP